MNSTNSNLRAGLAAGLLANGIWGLFPLYWHLLGGAASTEILAHRIVWCLVSLAAALALTGRLGACARAVRALASDRRLALTLFAATVFASANWLINIVGANTDRVVELGIGMFITPLATVGLGMAFFHEQLSRTRVAAVALAAAGVLIMIFELGRFPWIAIGVSASWAVYGALKKTVRMDPWYSITVEHAMMAPFALAWLAWLAASGEGVFLAPGRAALSLELMGTGLLTLIPMVSFSIAAQKLPLILLGIIQYLNPVMTLLLGLFWFGEPISRGEVIPLLFIWSGIALYLVPSAVAALREKARQAL